VVTRVMPVRTTCIRHTIVVKDDQPTEGVGVHSMSAGSLVRGTGCGTLTQEGEGWFWSKKRVNMKVSEAVHSIQKRDIVQPTFQPGGTR
jgi:hypothetical protein